MSQFSFFGENSPKKALTLTVWDRKVEQNVTFLGGPERRKSILLEQVRNNFQTWKTREHIQKTEFCVFWKSPPLNYTLVKFSTKNSGLQPPRLDHNFGSPDSIMQPAINRDWDRKMHSLPAVDVAALRRIYPSNTRFCKVDERSSDSDLVSSSSTKSIGNLSLICCSLFQLWSHLVQRFWPYYFIHFPKENFTMMHRLWSQSNWISKLDQIYTLLYK